MKTKKKKKKPHSECKLDFKHLRPSGNILNVFRGPQEPPGMWTWTCRVQVTTLAYWLCSEWL